MADAATCPGTLAPGRRLYAVGDIHGRFDLLSELVEMIRADDAERGPAQSGIVLLGDLIDRGPQSREVVRWAMRPPAGLPVATLMGNHEALLLELLAGETGSFSLWLHHGGRDTLASWGVDEALLLDPHAARVLPALRDQITLAEFEFLSGLPAMLRADGYLFAHAGIRPGVPFARQRREHLLWIRDEFLNDESDHGAIVVHGHTPADAVEERSNRINLDTGAFMSGRLTAMGMEGDQRWFLQTAGSAAAADLVTDW